MSVYYLVTGWHEADDGTMTHTETWTCDNEESLTEKKVELLNTGLAFIDESGGPSRRAFSVRFERVTEVHIERVDEYGDPEFEQEYEFLEEFWFHHPLSEWHREP